jgi:glycosyltransferase involved in cell wall biosynthesis
VCLATFNGERFVREQVDSILPQLGPADELVISDDGSSDGTLRILKSYSDRRVVVETGENVGHVGNFERALARCSGDIIFLCDQDDVWSEEKVATVLKIFLENPRAAMVHHGYQTIDSCGRRVGQTTTWKPGFRAGLRLLTEELVRPRIFGSCLALRAFCLPLLLPFPKSAYAHDHWAGIVGALTGGVVFVNEPLTLRRIHESNVTPRHGLGPWKRVRYRVKFVAIAVVAAARVFAARWGRQAR